MFTRETQRLDYVQRRSFNWMKHYIYVAGRCSRWLIRNRSYFPVKCSAIQMKYVVTEYFTDIFLPRNYVFCLCVPCVCNQVTHIKWRYTCGALTECVSIGFLLFTLAVPFVVVASAKHLISYLCLKTTTRRLTRFFFHHSVAQSVRIHWHACLWFLQPSFDLWCRKSEQTSSSVTAHTVWETAWLRV